MPSCLHWELSMTNAVSYPRTGKKSDAGWCDLTQPWGTIGDCSGIVTLLGGIRGCLPTPSPGKLHTSLGSLGDTRREPRGLCFFYPEEPTSDRGRFSVLGGQKTVPCLLLPCLLSLSAKGQRLPDGRRCCCFGFYSARRRATATSLTLVPVGPVKIRPPVFCRAW